MVFQSSSSDMWGSAEGPVEQQLAWTGEVECAILAQVGLTDARFAEVVERDVAKPVEDSGLGRVRARERALLEMPRGLSARGLD